MYNQQNQHSLQYTNPAVYMELLQKGVSNPDLYVHWTTTDAGKKAIAETEQYLAHTFNEAVSSRANFSTDIDKITEENKMLKSDIEELKQLLLSNLETKEVKKEYNGNRKKD